jgi:hypothetical protein
VDVDFVASVASGSAGFLAQATKPKTVTNTSSQASIGFIILFPPLVISYHYNTENSAVNLKDM